MRFYRLLVYLLVGAGLVGGCIDRARAQATLDDVVAALQTLDESLSAIWAVNNSGVNTLDSNYALDQSRGTPDYMRVVLYNNPSDPSNTTHKLLGQLESIDGNLQSLKELYEGAFDVPEDLTGYTDEFASGSQSGLGNDAAELLAYNESLDDALESDTSSDALPDIYEPYGKTGTFDPMGLGSLAGSLIDGRGITEYVTGSQEMYWVGGADTLVPEIGFDTPLDAGWSYNRWPSLNTEFDFVSKPFGYDKVLMPDILNKSGAFDGSASCTSATFDVQGPLTNYVAGAVINFGPPVMPDNEFQDTHIMGWLAMSIAWLFGFQRVLRGWLCMRAAIVLG